MTLDPASYISARQIAWARRHGRDLIGSAGDRGRPAYTKTLDENLFRALSSESRAEYQKGDGGELGRDARAPGKMQAVHSSSALTSNLFEYWRAIGRVDVIAKACGLPSGQAVRLAFEQHLEIDARFRYSPNLDVLFSYARGPLRRIGVECKFCEAFSSRPHGGLKAKYLEGTLDGLWGGMPRLKALGGELSPANDRYRHLDAAQLLKHLVALRKEPLSQLLYLYYDVPGPAGAKHREELEDFKSIAGQDGVIVASTTYQDVILRLADGQRSAHPEYVDYMVERYL